MSLATPQQLGDFVEEDIGPTDPRALSVLRIASNLVRAHLRWTDDPSPVPEAAEDVTIDVAARVWFNPEGVESDGIDDAQRRFGVQAHERFYLTRANKLMLEPWRERTGGLYTISVHDERTSGTIYVPTGPPPSGQPFPWYDANDPLVT